jgi:hypothetical protein
MDIQAAVLIPGFNAGSNIKIRFRHWKRQSSVLKRLIKVAAIVVTISTAHAEPPHYFHLKVTHPTYQRIIKALRQLEHRTGGAR